MRMIIFLNAENGWCGSWHFSLLSCLIVMQKQRILQKRLVGKWILRALPANLVAYNLIQRPKTDRLQIIEACWVFDTINANHCLAIWLTDVCLLCFGHIERFCGSYLLTGCIGIAAPCLLQREFAHISTTIICHRSALQYAIYAKHALRLFAPH